MNILLLGGTQFVGRHIAAALGQADHTVTLFNRGQTADPLPPDFERLRGDRDQGTAGLGTLKGRTWDVCIDVSGFTATHVRSSAETLRGRVGRYLFITAVSVYGDPQQGPVDETFPRLPPAGEEVTDINRDTYGPLKVTCENIVQEIYGDRSAILRPQIVAGPHDPYDRFSYWVRRATRGGETLAPGDGSDFVQTIDAGDVARFVRTVCERGLSGAFNLSGPRLTWAEFLTVLGIDQPVWVPAPIIRSWGLTESELPLYRTNEGPRSRLMDVCNHRALEAGLELTTPEVTAREIRAWLPEAGLTPALSAERETELLALWRHTREDLERRRDGETLPIP